MNSTILTVIASAVVGLSVPGAALAGHLARRPVLRWVAVGLGLAIAVANHAILEGGYRFIHMFLSLSAAALIGSALADVRIARGSSLLEPKAPRERWLARAVLGVLAALSLAAIFAPKSRKVGAAFARSDTAVLQTLLGRFGPEEEGNVAVDPVTASSEWFVSRDGHPDIPPTPGGLGVSDPIVLFITIDAVRAEVLSNPTYAKQVPELRALADEAVWFSEARTVGSGTVTTFASVFTGKHHFQLLWRKESEVHAQDKARQSIVGDESIRFPEALSGAGIHTSTIVSFPGLHPDTGVVRGFQEARFIEPAKFPHALSGPMIDAVIEGIDSNATRSFLFAHLMDPHSPYDSAGGKGGFDSSLLEAGACSRAIGRLIADLKARGLWDRTILIVAADHGEGFKKHKGVPFHNVAIYEEIARVPLIIRVPGLAPRVVDTPVSLIDLGPTILDAYGLPTPGWFMGQSLVPLLRGQEAKLTRPIVASTLNGALAYYEGSRKIIWDKKKKTVEMFDLAQDPDERDNIADGGGDQMLSRLAAFRETHRRR
jgi:hypothetical protein